MTVTVDTTQWIELTVYLQDVGERSYPIRC
jgi:hypothetical protein